jgi:hypothetical protein
LRLLLVAIAVSQQLQVQVGESPLKKKKEGYIFLESLSVKLKSS